MSCQKKSFKYWVATPVTTFTDLKCAQCPLQAPQASASKMLARLVFLDHSEDAFAAPGTHDLTKLFSNTLIWNEWFELRGS